MNSILLIDPEFDTATAKWCELLIKIGIDSFSYAIVNTTKNAVMAVYDEQECEDAINTFAQKLKTDPYLQLPYNDVKLTAYTQNSINIPAELYNESTVTSHSQYFADEDFSNIYINHQALATTLFTIPNRVDELIGSHLPGAKVCDTNSCLSTVLKNDTKLSIDFTVGSFNLRYTKNGETVFQKAFDFFDIDEFNYYLLLIINQLSININETSVYLSGIVHEDDEKYNCIKKYFGDIGFSTPQTDLNISVLDDMPSHYYTTLLNLHQCV